MAGGEVVGGRAVGWCRWWCQYEGDRPIQVGSHFHFAEANQALAFDRGAAWGMRLAIPAGTSVRFEPGIGQEVGLVPLGGRRIVPGLRGLAGGAL